MANRIISSTCSILRTIPVEAENIDARTHGLLRIKRHLASVPGWIDSDPEHHRNPAVHEAWHIALYRLRQPQKRRRYTAQGSSATPCRVGLVTRLERRQSVLVRIYRARVRELVKRWRLLGVALTPKMVEKKMAGIALAKGRAQWKRWYRANRQYQRRLGALKQCARSCRPELAALPRAMIA